jgi:ubiquitin-protein ligase
MWSPRIRRLKLDYDSLQKRFFGWPLIRMVGTAGMPPELYRFQYLVKGLYVAPDGAILERNDHLLEVNLSLGYPRRAPQCRMLTPVFHPNFDDSSVCIGDFWAASEALDDLIIRIGRMLSYQEYNTKSPLNGLAAKWAAQNTRLLPVDPRPIAPPLGYEPTIQPMAAPAAAMAAAASPAPPLSGIQTQQAPAHNSGGTPAPAGDDPWSGKIVIS